MASGRRGGHFNREGGRSSANEGGLRSLGDEIDGGGGGPVGNEGGVGPVANEGGLRALGERIDRAGSSRVGVPVLPPPGEPPPPPPPEVVPPKVRKKRWSTRRKVLTALASLVMLALLLAGAGYGYLRYEWSQVKTVNCPSCVAVANGAPFNVLFVGSDSRAGITGAAAGAYGSSSQVVGQRSDTIKILHVDPQSGTARLLSIPRDTYLQMSGLPANSGLSGPQKINTAYNDGPDPLIKTIENTFGIPISHFIDINFTGVINTVNTLGGINLDFPYPVRDDDNGNNNAGLSIPQAGCQTLNGTMALALSRSRYYQYYANGQWNADPSSDIGRIARQNTVIEGIIEKAKSTYNPLTLASFVSSVVHDVVVDKNMTFGDMYGLAERYHAFSPSSLTTYTLPTTAAVTPAGADVEVVSEPAAQQTLQAFLGTSPNPPTTPPLDQDGNPLSVPPPTTAPATTAPATTAPGGSSPPVTAPPSAKPDNQPYDPTPC